MFLFPLGNKGGGHGLPLALCLGNIPGSVQGTRYSAGIQLGSAAYKASPSHAVMFPSSLPFLIH